MGNSAGGGSKRPPILAAGLWGGSGSHGKGARESQGSRIPPLTWKYFSKLQQSHTHVYLLCISSGYSHDS